MKGGSAPSPMGTWPLCGRRTASQRGTPRDPPAFSGTGPRCCWIKRNDDRFITTIVPSTGPNRRDGRCDRSGNERTVFVNRADRRARSRRDGADFPGCPGNPGKPRETQHGFGENLAVAIAIDVDVAVDIGASAEDAVQTVRPAVRIRGASISFRQLSGPPPPASGNCGNLPRGVQ